MINELKICTNIINYLMPKMLMDSEPFLSASLPLPGFLIVYNVSHWWWDKVALAKSVDKLPLAESASKARLIVVAWYFMFAFRLLYVRFRANLCLQFSIGMAQGGAIIRVGLK